MSVWCLCNARIFTLDDGSSRQMLGLCESCLTTGDCRKSSTWVEPKVHEPKKGMEAVDWKNPKHKK